MDSIKFWGVQGSCPGATYPDNLGSNTACVSIETNDTLIILDAGTGLRNLGDAIEKRPFKTVALLLTHAHWDHIQGFPLFSYIYQDKPLLIYSHANNHIQTLLNQVNGVNFPVGKDTLRAKITTTTNLTKVCKTLDLDIQTIKTNHNGNCIGYRIISKAWDVCYIPDNQLHEPIFTPFETFVSFCKNTNILIHDSQYSQRDMPLKQDWGHSLYTDAFDLAMKSNASHFVLFHHEPTREKKDILFFANDCQKKNQSIRVTAATEFKSIDLLGN